MAPFLLGLAAFAAGQDSDPVKSSGPWVAKYEEQMCVLSRPYGADPAKLQFALRPMPGDEFIEVLLISPNAEKPFSRPGKAKLELLPSGQTVEPLYRHYSMAECKKRIGRFFVERSQVSDLAASTSIRIALDKETHYLALTRAAEALQAIQGCEDEMLRGWGLDPEAMRNIAAPARPLTPEQSWIRGSDYPVHATTRSQSGSVRMRWTIDTTGAINDCAIVQSSGYDLLDRLSCKFITERGRYSPAIDKQGNPAVSFRTRTVMWQLVGPTLQQLRGG